MFYGFYHFVDHINFLNNIMGIWKEHLKWRHTTNLGLFSHLINVQLVSYADHVIQLRFHENKK
jgi:hypothetical protein